MSPIAIIVNTHSQLQVPTTTMAFSPRNRLVAKDVDQLCSTLKTALNNCRL